MATFTRLTFVIIASLTATVAAADPQTAPAVRVLSPRLEKTLVDAMRRSPSLRILRHELERSDLIVHITGRPLRPSEAATGRLAGTMQFVTAAPTRRFLRITVDESLPQTLRAAILAHELWHALEVARAPHVVDRESFNAHYRHIGHSPSGNPSWYDTHAAVAAGSRVLREVQHRKVAR